MQAHRSLQLLGAVLLALLACLSTVLSRPLAAEEATLSSRANPDFPDPRNDSFYAQTADIKGARNGQILRRRTFPSVFASPNLGGAFQLFYKTSDTHLKPQGTVAAIHVPAKPASPPRIVSVQYFEDSVSVNCAPSWAAVEGTDSGSKFATLIDPGIITQWALKQGWYVVSADFEGPDALFIAGHQAGRAGLDAIRALIGDQKLPTNTPVALYGYSGGAHATLWIESLQAEYAPEINIVGSAHGGTPVVPKLTLLALNKGVSAGFGVAGLLGLMGAYPDLNDYVYSIVTEAGKKKLDEFKQPNYCLPSVALGSAFLDVFSYSNVSNPLDNPIAVKALKAESLLSDYASFEVPVPKFPRFLYHAIPDEIVPYEPEKRYVDQQCARGANIQFDSQLIGEHFTGLFSGIAPSMNFIKQSFEGKTPKVKCGTVFPDFKFGLDDPKAKEVMGDDILKLTREGQAKAMELGFL